MDDKTTPANEALLGISEIFALLVFILGIIGWIMVLPLLDIVISEWAIYPDAGDAGVGMLLLVFVMVPLSVVLLAVSIPLSCKAVRLPKLLRIITVISPALGCLAGLLVLYRALGG